MHALNLYNAQPVTACHVPSAASYSGLLDYINMSQFSYWPFITGHILIDDIKTKQNNDSLYNAL